MKQRLIIHIQDNQKVYVCYHDNTNWSRWAWSVDELSWDLLQGAERLLKLEALGDGLLLGSQRLLLRGGGLAALPQGVGGHDYQLLRHRAFPLLLFLLLSRGRAAGRLGAAGGAAAGAAAGAGCLLVLHREDFLRRLGFLRL